MSATIRLPGLRDKKQVGPAYTVRLWVQGSSVPITGTPLRSLYLDVPLGGIGVSGVPSPAPPFRSLYLALPFMGIGIFEGHPVVLQPSKHSLQTRGGSENSLRTRGGSKHNLQS